MFEIKDTEKITAEAKLSTPASLDVKVVENIRLSTPACHDIPPYGGERIRPRPGPHVIHSKEVAPGAEVKFTTPASMEAEIRDLQAAEITREAEIIGFAPTMEVQAALIREEFLNIPELHYENWKDISVAERLEAMNAMEQKVAQIAMRDTMPVYCENMGGGILGFNDGGRLVINERLMADDAYESYLKAMDTLFHEGRHSYQDYNLLVKRVEQSDQLVGSWIANYKLTYDDGDRLIFKQYGMLRYYTQPLEVDARLFAETVMRELEL